MKKNLFLVLFLLFFGNAFSQNFRQTWAIIPTTLNVFQNSVADEFVKRHNYWRAELGIEGVTWSPELEKYAQAWANELARNGCEMQHRPRSGKWKQIYGENIYWTSGMNPSPAEVVDAWASEKEDFDHSTQTCRGDWSKCGHYTQVIWQKTKQVGCASARCGQQTIWVCNYNPAGNYSGEKPYIKK